MSIYADVLIEHLPRGWSYVVTQEYSCQLRSVVTKYYIRSGPDLLGRHIDGCLHVTQENGETTTLWRRAVLKTLCAMDAQLVWKLTLVKECPTINGLTRRAQRDLCSTSKEQRDNT